MLSGEYARIQDSVPCAFQFGACSAYSNTFCFLAWLLAVARGRVGVGACVGLGEGRRCRDWLHTAHTRRVFFYLHYTAVFEIVCIVACKYWLLRLTHAHV